MNQSKLVLGTVSRGDSVNKVLKEVLIQTEKWTTNGFCIFAILRLRATIVASSCVLTGCVLLSFPENVAKIYSRLVYKRISKLEKLYIWTFRQIMLVQAHICQAKHWTYDPDSGSTCAHAHAHA